MNAHDTVAVVICAYTERRWTELVAAYRSVLDQTRRPDEVIVVIDHNDALLARFAGEFPDAQLRPNHLTPGLSGARNSGVAATACDLVLFLDDDARAEPDWVAGMTAPFVDRDVVGVGGWADPEWDTPGRPGWFPEPFLWVVGCSYQGLPTTSTQIRNPLGCAMGVRRSAWERIGGFTPGIGRVGTHPVGCEETEFFIRLRQQDPHARVMAAPRAVVRHKVTADRRTWRYFLRRCHWEGVSKAVVARSVGADDALESERAYTTTVLPRAFATGLWDGLRGRFNGFGRAAAVAAGLLTTMGGYARGKVSRVTAEETAEESAITGIRQVAA